MHETVRVVATDDYTEGGKLETRTVIPADTVRKFIIKNASGEVSALDGFDFSTVEYAAFDVNGAGVVGWIMPATEGNGYLNVKLEDGSYVITRGIEIGKTIKKGSDLLFGHRLYTSDSHQFNDFRKEAYVERNPLTDVFIAKNADDAKFEGYDALAGCYVFSVRSTEFTVAYYQLPDKHFAVNALICGDGVVDRTIYVRTEECLKTRRGRLECAAILDENNVMLPLPLEVGKNFDGENEEPLFFPEHATGQAAYGETYVPITVGKDENKRAPMLWVPEDTENPSAAGMCTGPEGMDSIKQKFPSAAEQENDPLSVLNYTKQAIAVRNKYNVIRDGIVIPIPELESDTVGAYRKVTGSPESDPDQESIEILFNTSEENQTVDLTSQSDPFLTLADSLCVSEDPVQLEEGQLTLPPFSVAILEK